MPLPQQVLLSEVDDFVPASIENRSQHEEAETLRLLISDRRRHGEFLSSYGDFDQRRAIVFECLCNGGFHLVRSFGSQSEKSRPLRNFYEVWIAQVGGEAQNAGGLHFQFDKGKRLVLVHNQLHRQVVLL